MKKNVILFFVTILLMNISNKGQAQVFTKEANIVYGNVSGAVLLMDVFKPAKSNGLGIIYIPGSAFGFVSGQGYDQEQLKADVLLDSNYTGAWVKSLLQKGYTVFAINHRNTPAFKYKDIIADCRRAVRFVRSNSLRFGISPAHIGAMGHSSGACLSALLGTLDDSYENAFSKTDSVSSKVQAVITLAAPFNLSDYNTLADTTIDNNFALSVMNAYIGELPQMEYGNFVLSGKFAEASPLSHVSAGDAPMLIYYSDNDPVIPYRQAIAMEQALQKNNVAVKTVKRTGQYHGPVPDMEEVDRWLKKWLK